MAFGDTLYCVDCHTPLQRRYGQSLRASLCCASATLFLLIPANIETFLTTQALGASRHSYLSSTAGAILDSGWPWLALAVFLFVVVFPTMRFGLLTLVLGNLYLDRRPAWLGNAFRWANRLETWAMLDVFLLALAVTYVRIKPVISVHVGDGAIFLIAAGVLSLLTRAVLDKAAIWESISPGRPPADPRSAVACLECDLLLDGERVDTPCPRCAAILRNRLAESIPITFALTIASLLLYIPANAFPMAILPIHYRPRSYTVLGGVIDLADAGFWDLALLVFTASFAIPVLKLLGLGWCALSVLTRSRRHLVAKTQVYRIVEEIGRWSMVDPFVIGCLTPVLNYNSLIHGGVGPAALPFTTVVILTIFSAKTFDPRLMWDAARSRP